MIGLGFLSLILLFALFVLTLLHSALRQLDWGGLLEVFEENRAIRVFYRIVSSNETKERARRLLFLSFFTLTLFHFAFLAVASITILAVCSQASLPVVSILVSEKVMIGGAFALLFAFTFYLSEFLPRGIAGSHPQKAVDWAAPVAFPLLFVALPFAIIFYRIALLFFPNHLLDYLFSHSTYVPSGVMAMMKQTTAESADEGALRKMIDSIARFKERIVREVMVPRVDVFAIPANTPILEAAQQLEGEGYSRIPLYEDSIDEIVGVLMYKDLLKAILEASADGEVDSEALKLPVGPLGKDVLYSPETKKISHLLQEFRKKQVHLAIVVDEYGGTEGIVTIEDILEEIVGNIADEYDESEENLFAKQLDGSWIVEGRTSIYEIEEQLGVEIPQEGDYDTIAGYIFHCAGTIPTKGFIVHTEEFQLEVISSDARTIEKVRITPLNESGEE